MIRRASIGVSVALAVVFGVQACGGNGEDGTGQSGDADVLARVGSRVITTQDVDDALQTLPQHQQAQYDGVLGRRRLLEQLIERRLVVMAAERRGLDEDPEIAQRIRQFRENLLTQAYHNYMLQAVPEPSEEELRAYYDAHHEEFRVLARVNASWIKCATRAEAEAARKRIVEQNEHFGTVAREVSIDDCSKKDGGLLGYFNPTGYVRCIGKRPDFSQLAFSIEADDVSDVFEWDDGWAMIKLHEKTTERPQPFSKARERIYNRLRPRLTDSLLAVEMERLRTEFGVESTLEVGEALADKSADDLMRLATQATNSLDKIDYYRALIDQYPHHERADQAQFMIGFELSEHLRDYDAARVEYQRVIDNYPDSSVRESAEWMMQNMGSGLPPTFEDAPSSNQGTR
jgi:peptidyl-prolyl cis-trans isomerase C